MPNCEPLRNTNGATETAPSGGAGDGVVEAGSTAANSTRASALLLLVLLLLARSRSPALGGRIGVPGNAALASLNFVGSGDLKTTTSCIMASRGEEMMRPDITRGYRERTEREKKGRGEREEVKPGIRNVIPASCGECQVRTGQSQHTSSSDEDTESP